MIHKAINIIITFSILLAFTRIDFKSMEQVQEAKYIKILTKHKQAPKEKKTPNTPEKTRILGAFIHKKQLRKKKA